MCMKTKISTILLEMAKLLNFLFCLRLTLCGYTKAQWVRIFQVATLCSCDPLALAPPLSGNALRRHSWQRYALRSKNYQSPNSLSHMPGGVVVGSLISLSAAKLHVLFFLAKQSERVYAVGALSRA